MQNMTEGSMPNSIESAAEDALFSFIPVARWAEAAKIDLEGLARLALRGQLPDLREIDGRVVLSRRAAQDWRLRQRTQGGA